MSSAVAARKRAAFHVLKVDKLDRITDDAVAITFEVPPELAHEFTYTPGQHVAVRATIAGDDVRRNYSICAPADSGVLRIGVKRLPGGVFSGYALERLQEGDSLEVMSPTGSFTATIDPDQARHYGAVAAGSGITPILSILSTALATEPKSQATLVFVNATTQSIMFLEELEDLKNRYLDRFEVFYVLDAERQESEVLSGRLDEERFTAILDGSQSDSVDDWFLCGPLPMTDMVREVLLGRGVADAHIHRELFHTSATPPPPPPSGSDAGEGYKITVLLDGRTTEFQLKPGTVPILDAARVVRSDIPYACKNGVCGTCRCKITSGTVDMVQNYALEPYEVDEGFVLSCQAYPTSDKVVADFDQ
ncbi:MAG: phenylacetic acid degradation protein [Actinomycetales bacterium]|nr:MAG: phenylacetic acid degradation protein [Actinomycetales bacterium]